MKTIMRLLSEVLRDPDRAIYIATVRIIRVVRRFTTDRELYRGWTSKTR